MEQGLFYEICGVMASICLILGYLPQAITTIRTRNTDGISLPGFLMMFIGAVCFVTMVCSAIVFCIKMHNDYFKKKE